MRSQFHAGDVCASSAGVADIFKRRLLTLCSDALKLRNFHICIQDLATVDVLRDIDYPPCAYWYWYIFCVYAYAHTRTLTTNIAREYIYIWRGLRVVGLIQRAMRRPRSMERQQSNSTLFLYASYIEIIIKQ